MAITHLCYAYSFVYMYSLNAYSKSFSLRSLLSLVAMVANLFICEITYKQVIPVIVKVSTVMILLGLVCMYLGGEKSLTPSEKKKKITDKK